LDWLSVGPIGHGRGLLENNDEGLIRVAGGLLDGERTEHG